MDILEKIKRTFGVGGLLRQEELSRLRRLPKDAALREFGAILYDECVKRATDFVKRELTRGDTPFRGVQPAEFYHEILAVTFWIMDRELAIHDPALLDQLHDNYFRTHDAFSGSREQRRTFLLKKYEKYKDAWNEITGHLDEFGLTVVQNIFGKEESDKTRERTFWIIQYADETAKKFSPHRKLWKELALTQIGRDGNHKKV